jgi:hypothetical protein
MGATNMVIASALHFIVFLSRTRDGRRVLTSVREVVGFDHVTRLVQSNEIYRPGPDRRAVSGAPFRGETLEELRAYGYEPAYFRTGTGST